ncbi:siderophore-interacting protein [Nocardioides lijunqiniae]|uniref:siderophore-interacting protein n=1 Tax=Nocardioides lijunqiniae TaxID=2760832 RepID=UPI0030B80AE8
MPRVHPPRSRRMITLRVLRREVLSPHFVRLTLTGPGLEHLERSGPDQAVRLFFPRAGQSRLEMPTTSTIAWMPQLLLVPKARRPWVRMYTVRAVRPELRELDVELAVHDVHAPAAAWALAARPGEQVGIFDEGFTYFPRPHAEWQLLVGEESALPAILAILEQAPASLVARVLLEVPEAADVRPDVVRPDGVEIEWVTREGRDGPPGAAVLETVRRAELPPGPSYTWVAGEARLATGLRRHLVEERGVPKSDITFVGYWREGRSAPG